MRYILAVLFLAVSFAAPSFAAGKTPFQEYNLDIDKYAFAKSYIQSLNYYGRLNKRLVVEQGFSDRFDTDLKVVKTLMDDRTLDNTELRVAKNYLLKYLESKNMLIRKVAYDVMVAYEQHIAVSSSERRLWQAYHRFKARGVPADFSEMQFKEQLLRLAGDRKAAGLAVLETVMMFKKVILSAKECSDENCHRLVLTQAERDKLIKKLDEFAADNMAWGIKVGQATFEAAVASLRECLEDTAFSSRK